MSVLSSVVVMFVLMMSNSSLVVVPTLHSDKCFGAEPKPLECFQFLCEYGGLKCERQSLQAVTWTQNSKNKLSRMKLQLTAGGA